MAKAGTQQRSMSMPDIIATKQAENMFVIHPDFVDDVRYIKTGQWVKLTLTKSRNMRFLAKYWVMIGWLLEIETIQAEFKIKERISDNLKIDAGYCYVKQHEVEGLTVITKTPMSISIESMEETEFDKFYQQVVNTVLNEWLERYLPANMVDQYADYFARQF